MVEKILAHDESLRDDWPVQGTTGYEFANLVLGLLVDPAGDDGLSRSYVEFAGAMRPLSDVVRDCKMRIMVNEMASELNMLARDAARVARQNPRTADFTRNILHRASREMVACFPVYRTYVARCRRMRSIAATSIGRWRTHGATSTDIDPRVFDFLSRLLSGDLVAQPRSGFSRQKVLRWAMRLQQYSGPVMAKGLEDTAFYRYNRFVALNEVGGHPDQFGVTTPAFHAANLQRAERWPHSMLSTSTHDTKRGEDVRARLAVLSELPEEWARQVRIWSDLLGDRRGEDEATAPDRNDEYLFYQLLIGSWPVELLDGSTPDAEAIAEFAERIEAAMVKSLREAKLHSTWERPDAAYEEAMLDFAGRRSIRCGPAFLEAFLPFAGAAGAVRRAQQPGADRAEAHAARDARHLPGGGAVGPEPGRSRQSAAGRLRDTDPLGGGGGSRAARRSGSGHAGVHGNLGGCTLQAGDDPDVAAPSPAAACVVYRGRLCAAGGAGARRGLQLRLSASARLGDDAGCSRAVPCTKGAIGHIVRRRSALARAAR